MSEQARFVVVLPQGLNASGVTLWGVRLVNTLARRGWSCGLILHGLPEGQERLALEIDQRVRVFDHPDLAPAGGEAMPDAEALAPMYRDALDALPGEGPIVLSPNLHGEVYGACARLTRERQVRLVGWQHSDIAYDTRVLTHYAGVLHAVVAVSERIEATLLEALGDAADRLERVPYGVELRAATARAPTAARPLRLVYTGRMEHHQKRIGALPEMSRRLDAMGVAHELVLVGDGPASAEVDTALRGAPSARRVGACDAAGVRRWLAWADALVLGSRYEGLSVSMLEAMASGCAIVLTRTGSGAAEAVQHGRTGLIAEVAPVAGEVEAGAALAQAVARLATMDVGAMGALARARAAERFGLEAHADRVGAILARVGREPARVWPADRPAGFAAGGGTVPPDAPERLARVLEALRGRIVAVHGAGAHTRACAHVLRGVAAIIDDDRGRWGGSIAGVPVMGVEAALALGVREVVLSSHLHEEALWARRGALEARGVRVHRLYGGGVERAA